MQRSRSIAWCRSCWKLRTYSSRIPSKFRIRESESSLHFIAKQHKFSCFSAMKEVESIENYCLTRPRGILTINHFRRLAYTCTYVPGPRAIFTSICTSIWYCYNVQVKVNASDHIFTRECAVLFCWIGLPCMWVTNNNYSQQYNVPFQTKFFNFIAWNLEEHCNVLSLPLIPLKIQCCY